MCFNFDAFHKLYSVCVLLLVVRNSQCSAANRMSYLCCNVNILSFRLFPNILVT